MTRPYQFDEFFASGRAETISPFLTPRSRLWGKNLPLKSALFAALLLLISFLLSWVNVTASHLCLASVYFLVGTPALIDSIKDLANLEINIDVLMTIAALLSVLIGSGIEGALLLVLFAISGSMEEAVMQKTKSALLSLRQMAPKRALIVGEDNELYERSVSEVPIGALILVQAGEIVPLDGQIVSGHSEVNLAHLTGEHLPRPCHVGDELPAGAHNMEGSFTLRVTRTSRDSTLARIIDLITHAQEAKPKVEQFLSRFGKWYASSIMLLALIFAAALPLLFGLPFLGIEGSIYRSLTFLIAASPCALIIATPTAYLSALSSCARKGLLLKGGVVLDALAQSSLIAFDKTGTLTTGELLCSKMIPIIGNLKEALAIAASIERQALHPISTAICMLATKQKASLIPIRNFKSLPGFGLEAEVEIEGKWVFASIGHLDFIESKLPPHLKESFLIWKKEHPFENAMTLLLVEETLTLFEFEDEIRPESASLISTLKARKGYELLLLTGDHQNSAKRVADALGILKYFANLRPEDKMQTVATLSQKKSLIMVGDGINDAPALARATVGISLGKIGSATAVDASDVVFLRDELFLLDWVLVKAKKTVRIVRENLTLALAVILLATTPALLGLVPLWVAVLLHEGGTLLVGLNSLRLLRS